MRAALWLRLRQTRRRGGPPLLLAGMAIVALVAILAGDTVDGRYGLATDLAAVLAYLAAVFFGAFPVAVDRERGRARLPAAAPVTPLAWAAGNALGAALVAGLSAFCFFAAAGAGAAVAGGIETHAVTRIGGQGMQWLPLDITAVPDDVRAVRVEFRSFLVAEEAVGTPDAATITLNGARHEVFSGRAVVLPATPPRIALRNVSPEFVVGILPDRVRVLGARRSFLLNSLRAAVAPALGAAALAALGAAAGAHLTAAVAALLTTLLLLLAGMKGFLQETLEHEGATRAAVETGNDVRPPDRAAQPAGVRRAAEGVVRAALFLLPDLGALDRTGTVARGEWIDGGRIGRALLVLGAALLAAAGVGGAGVASRRTS